MEERIQKILAQAGIASRRASEELILAGRVKVNGKTAEIGQKADPARDKIAVDGKEVKVEQKVYIALHKPRFVLSTVEPEPGDERVTVRDLIPAAERLYPVGRLDYESEGLVLMTNDGDLAQQLTHPSHGHEKEYRVLLARQPDAEQLATWRRGVVLEDGYKTQPAEVSVDSLHGKGAWLRVIMREGRKRQIREIGGLLGLPVVRIVRVRIGSLRLGTLKPKEWRTLSDEEIAHLKGEKPARPPRQTRRPASLRSEQGTFKKKSSPPKSSSGEFRREQKPGPARRKPSRPPR